MATDTTIETESLSVTNPTKKRGNGKVDKKAKVDAQAEAAIHRTLRLVATATSLGTMFDEKEKQER